MRSTVVTIAILASFVRPTFAQESLPSRPIEPRLGFLAPSEPDAKRLAEMKQEILRWNKAAEEYEDFIAKYRNRRWIKYMYARERMPAPLPPVWLESECAFLDQSEFIFILDWQKTNKANQGLAKDLSEIDPFQQACIYLFDLKGGIQSILAHQARAATAVRESEGPRIQFGMRLHLDLSYIPSEFPTPPIYGPVGLHLTVMNIYNRVEIFGPPGTMWVNLPDGNGGRESQALWTWGVGLRTVDFTLPGTRERLSLHLNLIKAFGWQGVHGGMNLMGLSLSPAKKK
jgi:hypothetical protein